MQTRFIIAAIAALVVVSAGGGLGVGYLWWGSSSGATEYADSDADERLGDLRESAMGDTDRADIDLGDAVDRASESGRGVAESAIRIEAEYRDIDRTVRDVTDGLEGDREIAGQLADIVRDGAYSVERGTVGVGDTAGSSADPAGSGGDESGQAGDPQPP
jgi:hypothetical protein